MSTPEPRQDFDADYRADEQTFREEHTCAVCGCAFDDGDQTQRWATGLAHVECLMPCRNCETVIPVKDAYWLNVACGICSSCANQDVSVLAGRERDARTDERGR